MRVLLAVDGTPQSAVAHGLVRSIRWPDGTQIEILRAQEPLPTIVQFSERTMEIIERALDQDAEAHMHSDVRELEAPGRDVVARSVHGRPAWAIVDEAIRMRADLVVLGSRGQGAIATMLLGSVAAEVVDGAPCPVLVARSPKLKRMTLADDGSPDAARAADLIREWPIFDGVDLRVVSVAPVVGVPVTDGPFGPDVAEKMIAATEALRVEHERVARSRAEALSAGGRRAQSEVRSGGAAAEIVASAAEHDVDLVVVGSRGRTGLARMVLGSVARDVLAHAPCSVLVVRRPSSVPA